MPYTINRFNGTQVAVVSDGTVDNTIDLKLIGKNYAGYGEIQNENFVFLLENFSNTTPPPRPSVGQIWFDAGNNKLKFRDSNLRWRTTGGAEVSDTEPAGLTTGDFWYNTASRQLFARDLNLTGSERFVLIGPQGVGGFGETQMRSRSVVDSADNVHAIIEAIVDGTVVYIISSSGDFTLKNDEANTIAGFSFIHKGLTLSNTTTTGETSDPQANNYRWWGTASDADLLQGHPANDFILIDNVEFPNQVRFRDPGFTVGDNDDLWVHIVENSNGRVPRIENQQGNRIEFRTSVNSVTSTTMSIVGSNILPGSDNANDIGSTALKFKTIYANSFDGVATKASTLAVGTTFVAASAEATSGTIVARTSSSETLQSGLTVSAGSIKANYFVGTATAAVYADLAEKYLADSDYEVGTVVIVGGEKEVTACQSGKRAIGAVSANPAYMMNSELEGGTFIALKGRIPVKVYGQVKKGAQLVAGNNGSAVTADPGAADVFAIALETNLDLDTKLVECIIL